MLQHVARYWWTFLVRGLLAIAFGIAAFVWPGLTLWALVILFGAYMLADGITALILGFTGRGGASWWAMALVGVLGIVAGLVAFFWPGITAVAMLAIIAASAIIRGIFEIVAAIRLRKVIDNEWLLALAGVVSILFGIALIAWPKAGLLAMVWLIGLWAVAFGILEIILAFRLRGLRERHEPVTMPPGARPI